MPRRSARGPSYLGVDVGGTRIKWCVVAETGVLDTGDVPTPRTGADEVLDAIARLHHEHGHAVTGVGVAMPGVVDAERRETMLVPNLPGEWFGRPVGRQLEQRCGKPIVTLNDARAFAYAELATGAARGASDALFVVLGTGVGGAMARDGRVLLGRPDALGEVGHVIVDPDGAQCGCGSRGCLETIAAAPALVRGNDEATSDPAQLAMAADAGDVVAAATFARAGRAIGIAAASACALLRFHLVVIGGGISGAFAHLAPAARDVLAQREALVGEVAVKPAELGPGAGAIGSALFAQASVAACGGAS